MKKIISRIIDIVLILLIIYLSFRLLQKKGIIETRLENIDRIPSFNIEDMEANKVTQKVFKDYDFTIVSLWSPLCGACFEELEALKELESYIKENNGNIIGIVTNGDKEMAEKELDNLGIKFTNLIPDKKFNRDFVKEVVVTPTTLFIDGEGNILEISTGSYGKEGDIRFFKNKVDELKK